MVICKEMFYGFFYQLHHVKSNIELTKITSCVMKCKIWENYIIICVP